MNFRLENNKVVSLQIFPSDEGEPSENTFEFNYKCITESETNFVIEFDFQLCSSNKFSLKLVHQFFFEISEPAPAEFFSSHYTEVNAPAIAYPYLRAFVATVLLNAGLESVYLPTVNFVEHAKQNKNK